MKTLVLFLFSLLAFANSRSLEVSEVDSRIVNGEDVDIGERPYQVSLQLGGIHFCGGSIITENWIITAAHCAAVGTADEITVTVGTIKLSEPYKTYQASQIISHEDYDSWDIVNDIALIKVSETIEFSDRVQPVDLPEQHAKLTTNSTAVVSGWGGLKNSASETPDRLQHAEIYIADPKYCVAIMKTQGMEINPTNVCANDPSVRRGQCNGDSGGPLVQSEQLIGLVSWSIKDPDCASTVYPGVYTKVAEYVDWITENIKE